MRTRERKDKRPLWKIFLKTKERERKRHGYELHFPFLVKDVKKDKRDEKHK